MNGNTERSRRLSGFDLQAHAAADPKFWSTACRGDPDGRIGDLTMKLSAANPTPWPYVERVIDVLKAERERIPPHGGSTDLLVNALCQGGPIISGGSIIGCHVCGQLWLHNCIFLNGIIVGCGCVIFDDTIFVDDGSIILLTGGVTVRTSSELMAYSIGNVIQDEG